MTSKGRKLDPPSGPLWLGLLAGPIAYTLYFVIVYSVVETACTFNTLTAEIGGIRLLSLFVLGLTTLTVLICAYAAYWSRRAMQQELRREYEVARETAEERSRFMGFASLLLGTLFGLVTLLTGLPVFLLSPCTLIP